MFEQKAPRSVWSIAMVAIFLFVAAISFAGVLDTAENKSTVAASAAN